MWDTGERLKRVVPRAFGRNSIEVEISRFSRDGQYKKISSILYSIYSYMLIAES